MGRCWLWLCLPPLCGSCEEDTLRPRGTRGPPVQTREHPTLVLTSADQDTGTLSRHGHTTKAPRGNKWLCFSPARQVEVLGGKVLSVTRVRGCSLTGRNRPVVLWSCAMSRLRGGAVYT